MINHKMGRKDLFHVTGYSSSSKEANAETGGRNQKETLPPDLPPYSHSAILHSPGQLPETGTALDGLGITMAVSGQESVPADKLDIPTG